MNPHKKTEHQSRVEDFMRKAGQALPIYPVVPPIDVRMLRAKLIMEEARETVNALGFDFAIMETLTNDNDNNSILNDFTFIPHNRGCDIVEVVDGCCDISVVTTGTLSAFGVADSVMLQEIDRTNLLKFEPGGYKDKNGKWIKPKGWLNPCIEHLLSLQGYKGDIQNDCAGTEIPEKGLS